MILPPPPDLEAFHRGEPVRVRVRMEPQPAHRFGRVYDYSCERGMIRGNMRAINKLNPLGPPGTRHGVGEAWACCVLHRGPDDEYNSVATEPSHGNYLAGRRHLVYRADGEDAFSGDWQPADQMPEWAVRTWATVVTPEPPERDADGWWWVAMVRKEMA